MHRKSKLVLASATFAAMALPWTAAGQTIGVTIGLRETNSTAPIGDPGGAVGGIEWVNLDNQFLTLNDTWQTFTWNFGTDPITAFAGATANGTLEGNRGVLEHVRFLNGVGSADQFEVFVDNIVNTAGGTPTTITGFEPDEAVPALTSDLDGTFLFRQPRFSGSTDFNLAATPNNARPTDLVADTGLQSLRFAWAFLDALPTRWVRMTTNNTPKKGNPTVDFTAGNTLTMRIRGRLIEPAIRWIDTDAGPSNWSDAANWNGGTVPGINFNVSDVAYFGPVITAPATVNVDVPIVINTLRLRSAQGYTFNTADPNTNNITLSGPAGSTGNINAQEGSHTINAPILLDVRALSVTVSEAAAVLRLNGGVNFDSLLTGAGQTMLKSGLGRVELAQVRSFIDNPDPAIPATAPRSLTISQGTVRLTTGGGNSRVNILSIAGVTDAWTSTVDLTNNAMIIDYVDPSIGGLSPLAAKENQIKSGYAGGSWNGTGIQSSAAATTPGHSVGIVEATDIGSPAQFLGENIDASTVLMRYTRTGDANLNGVTNIQDFSLLAANFNQPGRWFSGDFNFDGNTNIQDFSLLAANFNQSAADGARGAVPEPATIGLIAAAGLLGLRRRR